MMHTEDPTTTQARVRLVFTWELLIIGNFIFTLVFFVILMFGIARPQPTHDDITTQQQQITAQLTYISCLLLVPPNERTPEAVASCQVEPETP